MDVEQSDRLFARIDAALARINTACERLPANDDGLRQRHDDLRSAVTSSLAQLDELIAQQQGAEG